jgi:hypothetical protein
LTENPVDNPNISSNGVVCEPDLTKRAVMGIDLHSFLLNVKGDAELYPIQELIWTKVAYVLGDAYPSLAALSPARS